MILQITYKVRALSNEFGHKAAILGTHWFYTCPERVLHARDYYANKHAGITLEAPVEPSTRFFDGSFSRALRHHSRSRR